MAQATIGSLNVVLGMDAGEFDAAVRKVEGGLSKLSAKFGFVAGVAAEFGRALVQSLGNSLGALGAAFKSAIDDADALDELSQKLGMTVEALGGLKYAAEISGAPVEVFTVGITKLAMAMSQIASGETTGAAARAMEALGISVTTANGQLRESDQVLLDLADRFSTYRDSAQKTALAVALFGESGAKMIPFLNAGREGIDDLREAAQRLGVVVGGNAAAAAATFNERLDILSRSIRAGFNKAMLEALPYMQRIVDYLLEGDRAFRIVEAAVSALSRAIRTLASFFVQLSGDVAQVTIRLRGMYEMLQAVGNASPTDFAAAWIKRNEQLSQSAESTRLSVARLRDEVGKGANEMDVDGQLSAIGRMGQPEKGEAPTMAGSGAAAAAETAATQAKTAAQSLHNAELQRYLDLRKMQKDIESDLDPVAAKLAESQDKLNKALQRGAIDSQTFGMAMSKASALAQSSYAGMASSIVGDITKVFGESKALAIAQALVNTYQAVTNAWANVPYPLNIAAAAASLAAGMAQVANIRNTSKNGSGGGGSSGDTGGAGVAAETREVRGVNISLQGQTFGREGVRDLINSINEEVRDGAILTVS